MNKILGATGALILTVTQSGYAQAPLGVQVKDERGSTNTFASPNPDARPHVYWYWMGGNISREGITADLEAMARVGISFTGEDGLVRVDRGAFEFILKGKTQAKFVKGTTDTSCEKQVALTERNFLKDAKIRLPVSKNHVVNFLDCVTTREKPIAHACVGAHTAICCHLMNKSYYHHQKMLWDPKDYTFRDGTGDPAWLTRDYRAPFKV